MKLLDNIRLIGMMCLTLGLAPFVNEEGVFDPHIWGKLKWIAGGANGMTLMDWGDALMHGAPWILLIVAIVMRLKKNTVSIM